MSRPSIVHVAAWGDRWRARAVEEVLGCFKANFFALQAYGEVRLLISTDDPSSFCHLGHRAEFHVVQDPGSDVASRDLMAACELRSLHAAHLAGADWFPLCADHVFPREHLSRVKLKLLLGKKAVVGTGLRCRRAGFRAEGLWWQLEAADFARAQLRHVHPEVLNYQVGREAPADIHLLVFPQVEGFAVRQGQPALLGLDAASVTHLPDRPMAECQLLADLTDDFERDLHFALPEEGMALAGLDDEQVTEFGRRETRPEGLVALQRIFERGPRDRALWRWSFEHRVAYGGTAITADEMRDSRLVLENLA